MSITRADIITSVKYQFKRNDKDSEINQAIQYIVDDICEDFDYNKELQDSTADLPLTTNVASLDVSVALANLKAYRIDAISLKNSDNSTDNRFLNEISFKEYLEFLPVPTIVTNVERGYPEQYAVYKDIIYFKPVPELTTFSVKVYFSKKHPTISVSQDILLPASFKMLIVEGVLWQLYKIMENKTGSMTEQLQIYTALKERNIDKYNYKPNQADFIRSCLI